MTRAEATAENFLTALKALPESERDAAIIRIASDEALGEDLLDMAIYTEWKDEPTRPFRKYLRQGRD